jgi:hypothetical protein
LSLPSRQLRRRSHAAVPVAEVLAVVEVSMVAALTSPAYAYDNGYGGGYDNGYAASNGYDCQPGTWFRDEYGRRHLCQ